MWYSATSLRLDLFILAHKTCFYEFGASDYMYLTTNPIMNILEHVSFFNNEEYWVT